jgi:hypothetical protein
MEDQVSALSPEARALLDLTRGAGEPDNPWVARARAALLTRVGIAGVAAVGASAIVTTVKAAQAPIAIASPSSMSILPLVGKILAAAVIVSGIAVGGYALKAGEVTSTPPQSPADVHATPPASPASPILVASVEAPAPPGITLTSEPKPQAPVRARTAVPSAQQAAQGSDLTEDVENLREAQAALVAGDPQRALAAAERVRPSGPLAEEREGVRVLARCALEPSNERTAAEAFVTRHPHSALSLRIQTACVPTARVAE